MDTQSVLSASFVLNKTSYASNERQIAFFRQLEQAIGDLPGVQAVGISDSLPPGGDPRSVPFIALRRPGGSSSEPGMGANVFWRYITPGHFAALRIRLVEGRWSTEEDRSDCAVINQALARPDDCSPMDERRGGALGRSSPWRSSGLLPTQRTRD